MLYHGLLGRPFRETSLKTWKMMRMEMTMRMMKRRMRTKMMMTAMKRRKTVRLKRRYTVN